MKSCSVTVFPLLFCINFLITFGFGVGDSLFPVIFSGIIGKGLYLSLAFTLYSVSKTLFMPISGRSIDKYGAVRVLGAALILYFAVSSVFLLCSDKYALIAARTIQGIACALFRPVVYCILVRICSSRIGRASGTFDMSFYLALAAGPFLGGQVLDRFGHMYIMAVIAVCCVIALVLFLLLAGRLRISMGEADNERGYEPSGSMDAQYYGLLFFIFFRAWGISTLNIYLPVFMNDAGFRPSVIGTATGLSVMCMSAMLFFTGRMADSYSRTLLVVYGGTAAALTYFFIPGSYDTGWLFSIVMLSGIFSAVSQPSSVSLLLEYASAGKSGRVIAVFNTVMGLGFAFSPLVNAVVLRFGGIRDVFFLAGISGIFGSCLFALFSAASGQQVTQNSD